MNRDDAEKALGIIRQVIQHTREDLVAHNWGLMWMIHSVTNGGACLAGWFVETRDPQPSVYWYLLPLSIAGIINLLVVTLLRTRDHGVRSYVEWHIHGIWTTFVVFTGAFAFVIDESGTSPKLFGSVFAMTSGMGFAMMGVVFSRQMPFAFLFFAVMLAGPYLPGVQWALIGGLWWAAMFLPGLAMHREKRRREADVNATRIL